MMDALQFKVIKAALALLLSTLTAYYTPHLWTLLGLVAVDMVTGVLGSWQGGSFSVRRFGQTGVKLFMYLAVITMMVLLGRSDPEWVKWIQPVYWYFMLTEALSIVANATGAGIRLPTFLTRALKLPEEGQDRAD